MADIRTKITFVFVNMAIIVIIVVIISIIINLLVIIIIITVVVTVGPPLLKHIDASLLYVSHKTHYLA